MFALDDLIIGPMSYEMGNRDFMRIMGISRKNIEFCGRMANFAVFAGRMQISR